MKTILEYLQKKHIESDLSLELANLVVNAFKEANINLTVENFVLNITHTYRCELRLPQPALDNIIAKAKKISRCYITNRNNDVIHLSSNPNHKTIDDDDFVILFISRFDQSIFSLAVSENVYKDICELI